MVSLPHSWGRLTKLGPENFWSLVVNLGEYIPIWCAVLKKKHFPHPNPSKAWPAWLIKPGTCCCCLRRRFSRSRLRSADSEEALRLVESSGETSGESGTLPETNSSHLKMHGWNTSFLLGWPIFRGYVSFRECNGVIRWKFLPREKSWLVHGRENLFSNVPSRTVRMDWLIQQNRYYGNKQLTVDL